MLRFFRQIRQRLFVESNFRKYLLYAIGEIVLVVFGILIALQINNWNDERHKQKELDILFQDTEEYLFPMSNWGKSFVENYHVLDSVIGDLNTRSTPEFYESNSEMVSFFFSDSLSRKLPSFYWVSPGMQDLINRKTDFNDRQKPILYDLIVWKEISQEVQDLTYEFDTYLEDLRQRLIDKAPFLLDKDQESVEKSIDFVCCSGWYRYELSRIKEFTEDLSKVMDLHWGVYGELYGQLMLVNQKYSAEKIDSLFQKIGRQPVQALTDFSPSELKKTKDFIPRRGIFMPEHAREISNHWLLLLNASEETITIQVLYEDWIVGQWSLRSSDIARRRMPKGAVVKIIYPDETLSYHTAEKGGYLIVD